MALLPSTHIVQVTNVAPAATLEQMTELFGFLGEIKDIKMYPNENYVLEAPSKVCYIQYQDKLSVGVAQHLTNTVFIDRALIVVPIADDGIPSEAVALRLISSNSSPGFGMSGINSLINEISGVNGALVLTTIDPKLTALGLPQYPPLPANLDSVKIEEIRRTVTVGNLDPAIHAEKLLKFMNQIGEVKFLRMASDSVLSKYAFVEFTDQTSVPKALQCNGVVYEGRPLIINHSTSAIVKPLPAVSETGQREINEAMKRVQEAESLITAVVEPELTDKEKRKQHRSRSRSRSRQRSTSHSRHKRRSRSRSKRSRSKRRSGSRQRSKTPSRHSRHKSRSRSRERRTQKTSSRHEKKKSHSRSRSRSRDKSKKHSSKSHSPSKAESKSKLEKRKKLKESELKKSRKSCSPRKDERRKKLSNETSRTVSKEKKSHRSPSRISERNSSYSKEDSKSPVRIIKAKSHRSHSKSHMSSDYGSKNKRKKSCSPVKESFSSRRRKYESSHKCRSRSQSRKRSRSRSLSRSKKSERKTHSPYSPRKSRHRSPSQDFCSNKRRSGSRERKLSKDRSEHSEKKSTASKEIHKTAKIHSSSPKLESENSKYKSRSQSRLRSSSPSKLEIPSRKHSTSPPFTKNSSSPSSSPSESTYQDRKRKVIQSIPGLSPIFSNDEEDDDVKDHDAAKLTKAFQNFGQACNVFQKLPQPAKKDCTLYAPEDIGYNYHSGSNSADMDLASD